MYTHIYIYIHIYIVLEWASERNHNYQTFITARQHQHAGDANEPNRSRSIGCEVSHPTMAHEHECMLDSDTVITVDGPSPPGTACTLRGRCRPVHTESGLSMTSGSNDTGPGPNSSHHVQMEPLRLAAPATRTTRACMIDACALTGSHRRHLTQVRPPF